MQGYMRLDTRGNSVFWAGVNGIDSHDHGPRAALKSIDYMAGIDNEFAYDPAYYISRKIARKLRRFISSGKRGYLLFNRITIIQEVLI